MNDYFINCIQVSEKEDDNRVSERYGFEAGLIQETSGENVSGGTIYSIALFFTR